LKKVPDTFAEVGISNANLILEFKHLENMIEQSCRRKLKSEIYFPSAASAVAMAMVLLCGNGCSNMQDLNTGKDASADTDTGTNPDECTYSESGAEMKEAVDKVTAAGCEEVCSSAASTDHFSYRIIVNDEGYMESLEKDDGKAIEPGVIECYKDALSGQKFSCLAAEGSNHYWLFCGVLLT